MRGMVGVVPADGTSEHDGRPSKAPRPDPKEGVERASRRTAPPRRWLGLAAAIVSGAAVAASFPPSSVPALAFVAYAPLLWALDRATMHGGTGSTVALSTALLGLASGLATGLSGFGFLVEVLVNAGGLPQVAAYAAFVLLGLWSGLGVALVSALAGRARSSGLPLGLAFALLHPLHERVWPALLPWSFGAVWLDHGSVAQLATYVGRSGLTALAILPSWLLAELIRAPRSRRSHALAAGSFVLIVGASRAGTARTAWLASEEERLPSLQVGLVHLEPPRDESRLSSLLESTRALEREGAELVVWSEGAVPGLVPVDELDVRFGRGLPGVRVPTWVGVVLVDALGRRSNTALFVTPRGVAARQDKRSLIPFAERTPSWLPLGWLGLPQRDFLPGRGFELARVGSARTAATICYEDTLGAPLRALVEATGAQLVVNLTHDGWFAHEPKIAERHLLLARLGAIELGRDVLRATDAGVTAWIDAAGRVRARTAREGQRSLLTKPTLRDERSVHRSVGDAPLALLTAGMLLASEARRRRRTRSVVDGPLSP
jgi:apolipoprotein N-acyltransferase